MSTPLQQLLSKVLFDPFTRSDFGADPAGFLRENGWSNLEGPELEEAVAALGDALPIDTAEALESACTSVDFSSEHLSDVGGILADVASQVDPELPTMMISTDTELDFGAGADTQAIDSESLELTGLTDDAELDVPTLSDIGRGLGDTDAHELDIDEHNDFFDTVEELDTEPIVDDIDEYDDATVVEAPDVDVDLEG